MSGDWLAMGAVAAIAAAGFVRRKGSTEQYEHRPLRGDEMGALDFEVCRCGYVRYPKKGWLLGQSFPGWDSWEKPKFGRVRLESRQGSAGRSRRRLGLDVFMIEKGTAFYHGTSAEEDFEIPNGPAWFSNDRGVAFEFVDWAGGEGPRRILEYEVTDDIEGLVLIESKSDMERMVDHLEEERGFDRYEGPHETAEEVCSSEVGWHIPWNYPSGSDTLLCEPDRFLRLVGVEYLDKRPRGWRK